MCFKSWQKIEIKQLWFTCCVILMSFNVYILPTFSNIWTCFCVSQCWRLYGGCLSNVKSHMIERAYQGATVDKGYPLIRATLGMNLNLNEMFCFISLREHIHAFCKNRYVIGEITVTLFKQTM